MLVGSCTGCGKWMELNDEHVCCQCVRVPKENRELHTYYQGFRGILKRLAEEYAKRAEEGRKNGVDKAEWEC